MTQQRLCLTCSTPFKVPPTSKRKYCSPACRPKLAHSRQAKGLVTVQCARCGTDFQRKPWEVEIRKRQGWALYCSTACRDAVRRGRKGTPRSQHVSLTCVECGQPFSVAPWEVKAGRRQCCSRSCSNRRKGRMGGAPRVRVGPDRHRARDGYVLVYVSADERPPYAKSKARHLEHRYVMSKVLGRWPEPNESVHHINGDRADNRPENLQLRSGVHGQGHVLRCRTCGSSDIEAVDL